MDKLAPYMNMVVSAAVILAVLLVFRVLNRAVKGRKGARLGISEYHEIDKSRRLVLVRRDDVEHLLLIGGPQDVVVESNIESALMAAPGLPSSAMQMSHPAMQANQPGMMGANIQPMPMRPPPRPAIFGDRRPPLRSVEPMMHMPRSDSDEP